MVQAVGTVEHVEQTSAGRELGVNCPFEDLQHGESVAVNGVCLTVRQCGRGWFTAAAGQQTLRRTLIGDWDAGRHVNLERALTPADRLGGHVVQGHVDGVGEVAAIRDGGDVLYATITVEPELAELFVPLGSVAVDGVSLTVNDVPDPASLEAAIIDYTRRNTTLGAVRPGARVHVEADVIARYVRHLLRPYLHQLGTSSQPALLRRTTSLDIPQ